MSDTEDLTNVFKRLYEDKKLMKRIGNNAYKFVMEKGYGWDKYIEKWEKVLESVLKKPNKIGVV